MSELLLPEHRYAKIMKERLNEDGRAFDLEFRSYSPATHGIFQNILLMDGERILEAEPTIGYIHRAFEKIAENPSFAKLPAYRSYELLFPL
jgi:NADH-quinone oxidoreductase subunit D